MGRALRFYDLRPAVADFAAEVLAGLAPHPKHLSPKFFYDQRGSQLFDAITELPEYYPTRTEIGILTEYGAGIAELLGQGGLLLELGSGSSTKIRVLLDALRPAAYMPVDISREHLRGSAEALAADYPGLQVHAVCADYTTDFQLPYCPQELPRAAFFPGSSIGNFEPDDARELLKRLAGQLGAGGKLLIGVDLKKDPRILHAAYDDAQQITAAFNLNLLARMNRELGADFDLEAFSHRAFFNEAEGRIEMHLVSGGRQAVTVAGQRFEFVPGETIHTENSYKYTVKEFQTLASSAGFDPHRVWVDKEGLFSIHYLQCRV